MIHQVKSKAELNSRVDQAGDKLVVIDFFTTWCGPCQKIVPLLEHISSNQANKLVVLKVDVDEIEELVGDYKIEFMPTFIFKRKGTHLDTLVGSNETKLQEIIDKHLKS